MRRVYQRIVDPERGDCYRAAVASLLDLDLDDVPEDVQTQLTDVLDPRDLCAVHLTAYNLTTRPPDFRGSHPWDVRRLLDYTDIGGAVAIASVPSQAWPDRWHAILVQFRVQPEGWVRCEVAHDPNPGNGPYDLDQTEIRSLTFVLPRLSWA